MGSPLKSLIFLLPLLAILGCNSQKAELGALEKTPLKFSFSSGAVTHDKIMFFGKSASGEGFAKVVSPGETPDFEFFGNEEWTFYAIGWRGANLSGVVDCAKVEKTLEGPKETLSFNLTEAACEDDVLRGDATGDLSLGFNSVEFCESVSGIDDASDTCSDDLNDGARVQARGHAMSYRYRLRTFSKEDGRYEFGDEILTTDCADGKPDFSDLTKIDRGLAMGELAHIPVGNGRNTPFYAQVEVFPGNSTCDGTSHGSRFVNLPYGLKSESSSAFYKWTGSRHKLFVKMSGTEICQGKSLTETFAGGVESSGLLVAQNNQSNASPRLICNTDQFYNLRASPYGAIKILKDIDLSANYKGVTALPGNLDALTSLGAGSNFFPLGMTSTYTVPSSVGEPRITFPYSFDGGGKTITGLRIHLPTRSRAGFFVNHNNVFRRVRIKDWKITGTNSVGTISRSTSTLQEIEIQNLSIKAQSSLGGLVGDGAPQVKNVTISQLYLESDTFACGGILGANSVPGSNSVLENISVSGEINCGSSVGGILGTASGATTTIRNVRFEGSVLGNSGVGGIAGFLHDGAILKSYVQGVIESRNISSANTGGLVGRVSSSTTFSRIEDSFFFGKIVHACTSAPLTNCNIGNLAGVYSDASWTTVEMATNFHHTSISGHTLTDFGTARSAADFYNFAPPGYVSAVGDLPRLPLEVDSSPTLFADLTHPCRSHTLNDKSLPVQIAGGRGRSSSPLTICNGKQFAEMTSHGSKHFQITSPFYAHLPVGDASLDLTGSIDGKNHIISGLTLNPATPTDDGTFAHTWWKTTRGPVKNLKFYHPTMNSAVADRGAFIALKNTSTMENIVLQDIIWDFSPSVIGATGGAAPLVHFNSGTIKKASVSGLMDVYSFTAGLVLSNTGLIEDSSSTVKMSCDSTSANICYRLAGFVYAQLGNILRSYVDVEISGNDFANPAGQSEFGLLANYNTGLMDDSHVEGFSHSKLSHNTGMGIANSGKMHRAYSAADIKVENTSLPVLNPVSDADWYTNPSPTASYTVGIGSEAEDIFYRYPARWFYPETLPKDSSSDLPCVVNSTRALGLFWKPDIQTPGANFFIARNQLLNSSLYTLTLASEIASALTFNAVSCSEVHASTLPFTIGVLPIVQPGASTFLVNPFVITAFQDFDGQTNFNDEIVWLANLDFAADLTRINTILRARMLKIPHETPPTWVFSAAEGLQLFHVAYPE